MISVIAAHICTLWSSSGSHIQRQPVSPGSLMTAAAAAMNRDSTIQAAPLCLIMANVNVEIVKEGEQNNVRRRC